MKPQRRALSKWLVTVLALLVALGIVMPQIARNSWDPSVRLAVGSESGVRGVIEAKLGEVPLTGNRGHDGQIYFLIAHDPLLSDPDSVALLLDRPTYRYQRILFPLLAWPALAVSEVAVVWALVALGLGAVAIGTWALSDLAEQAGRSPLAGMAFVANPGVVSALLITGSGVLAWAFAAAGLSALVRRRRLLSAALFTLATLTREPMIIVPIGASLWLWRTERVKEVGYVLYPAVVAGTWGAYLRWRLPGESLADLLELGMPFQGLASAIQQWISQGSSLDGIVGFTMVGVAAVLLVRTLRSPSLLVYSASGFALLAIFLTEDVWTSWFNSSRALIPAISAVIVAALRSDVIALPRRGGAQRVPQDVQDEPDG